MDQPWVGQRRVKDLLSRNKVRGHTAKFVAIREMTGPAALCWLKSSHMRKVKGSEYAKTPPFLYL